MRPFKYIHHNKDWEDNYNAFHFVSTYPKEDRQLVGNCNIYTCREFFTKSYGESFQEKYKNRLMKAYAMVINGHRWTKERQATLSNRMANSLALINHIEKHFGRPLTRLYPVDTQEWVPAMLFIGSKRWLKTRYSLGLWTLIIRLGWKLPMVKVKKALAAKDFNGFIENLTPPIKNSHGDEYQLAIVLPKISAFMEFEKTLGSNYKLNWSTSNIPNEWVRAEGICKLLSGQAKDTKFKELWANFCKKE